LPEDGVTVTAEELSELTNEVEKLRGIVSATTLPERVKRFVFEQLNIISRAIRDYPLAGAKAFRTAVQDVIFHTGEHADIVSEYKDAPVMSGLKQIWEKTAKYAKYAINASKFLGALDIIYHHLQGAPVAAHQLEAFVERIVR
ncbi:MAG TPA: hypothetical protein VHQ22_05180, partial [Terriglobales bacterium]|jgi:hypothetical protein|nr:hypothetical protein [Terriglobales bacterium]